MKEKDGYTCRTARGLSVVDYFLVPHEVLTSCYNFCVTSCLDIIDKNKLQHLLHRRSKVPDHAYLSFDLSINVEVPQIDSGTDDRAQATKDATASKSYRKYRLKQMRPDFMQSVLCKEAMLRVIANIECNRETQDELDSIYKQFTDNVVNEMNRAVPYFDCSNKVKKRFKSKKSF